MGELAPKSRLRWRCRRGTRELDVLLGGFLERCFDGLDEEAQAAFARMLEEQDPILSDWIWGRSVSCDVELNALVQMIRRDAGLAGD